MAHRRLRDGALSAPGSRSRRRALRALAAAALCAAAPASACGSAEPTEPGPSPSVAARSVCEAGAARTKPVPAAARDVVEAFVAALARGDRAAARRALDPAIADGVLSALAPVERLTLLSFSDDY